MKIEDSLLAVDRRCGEGEVISIENEEARHMLQVRRFQLGDSVYLSSGNGDCYLAKLIKIENRGKAAKLQIHQAGYQSVRGPEVILVVALPKGERQSTMLNMATQLGMNRFIPLHCGFSAIQFQPKRVERWQRIIETACKQSRQCHFPIVESIHSPEQVLNQYNHSDVEIYIGDDNGVNIGEIESNTLHPVKTRLVMIGLEGGFGEAEKLSFTSQNSLESNLWNLKLGDLILRTESATISMLAVMNQLDRG